MQEGSEDELPWFDEWEQNYVEGMRNIFLRVGTRHFGGPDAEVREVLDSIKSYKYLNGLADRLFDAENWRDLLRM